MSRLHELNVLLAGVETPDDLTEQERANHRIDLCEFLQAEIEAESDDCSACGRESLDCSINPCPEVIEDREDLVLKADPEGQRFQDASLGERLLK